MTHTIDDLVRDLASLGLETGDTVLVRAAAKKIGDVEGKPVAALIGATLKVIGPTGTLVGLAFTRTFAFPRRHQEYTFDATSPPPPTTGGFAAALVGLPGAVRSAHPTNGFVAIGSGAQELLADHDETTSCFHPMEKLIARGGKMILVGCVEDSPGFSTVHIAQHHLGLSTKSLMGPLSGVRYRKAGAVRLYTKWDTPGCSMGFHRFYEHYERAGILMRGKVGDADSMGISAASAYAVERRLLAQDPKFALCQRPECVFCRGSLLYNLGDMPGFYGRMVGRIWEHLRARVSSS